MASLRAYVKHINADSTMEVVLRGHLHVDSELVRLIETTFRNRAAFNLARLSFPHKIDLAIALGVLPANEKGGYVALNRVRNKIAHDLKYEVSEQDEADILAALGPEARRVITPALARPREFPYGLRAAMTSLHAGLLIWRQAHVRLQGYVDFRNRHAKKLDGELVKQYLARKERESERRRARRLARAASGGSTPPVAMPTAQ